MRVSAGFSASLASTGIHGWFNRLFETHPPLEARIAALREAAGVGVPGVGLGGE
jgi:Zn-dependent protease with chaperone function